MRNKKELLQKIKNEVATKHGFDDFETLCGYYEYKVCVDEVANRYAIACCEEQKKQDLELSNRWECERGLYNAIKNTKNVAE